MPGESKKFLFIALMAGVFVLVVLGAAFFVFAPGKDGGDAVAEMTVKAAPKADNPQDFLSDSASSQAAPQDSGRSGDIIIVYGDKPDAATLTTTTVAAPATSSPAVQAPSTTTTLKAVKPAAQAPAPAKTATTPAKTASPAAPTATPAATTAPASSPAPAATGTTIRVAPSPQPAAKSGQAWIQAGSFSVRASADKVKAALQARGIESAVTVKETKGKKTYQVKAGPYPTKDEARKWLTTVRAASGSPDAFVTD